MNEQTNQMLERLAQKLGTTVEHLWGVLVKQAPISSATDGAILLILVVILIWGYRIIREKTKDGGDWNDQCGSAALPWIIWMVFLFVTIALACTSLSTIIAGFINPEYWALKEIIH